MRRLEADFRSDVNRFAILAVVYPWNYAIVFAGITYAGGHINFAADREAAADIKLIIARCCATPCGWCHFAILVELDIGAELARFLSAVIQTEIPAAQFAQRNFSRQFRSRWQCETLPALGCGQAVIDGRKTHGFTRACFRRRKCAATMIVRLRDASAPARVKGKRLLFCVFDAAKRAARRLSTPEGVKVFSQSFAVDFDCAMESAAKAGITNGETTSEPVASNAAAKTAFFRRKGLPTVMTKPKRLPVPATV